MHKASEMETFALRLSGPHMDTKKQHNNKVVFIFLISILLLYRNMHMYDMHQRFVFLWKMKINSFKTGVALLYINPMCDGLLYWYITQKIIL